MRDGVWREETQGVGVSSWTPIAALAIFSILFFAAQAQGGGLLMVYIHRYTERHIMGWEIPTLWLGYGGTLIGLVLGPLYASIWSRKAKEGTEPAFSTKLSMGVATTGVAFIVMLGASLARQATDLELSGIHWLFAYHVAFISGKLITIPCLWASVERLSPSSNKYLSMGLIIGCISLGNLLGGFIGKLRGMMDFVPLFTILASMCFATALLTYLVLGRLLVDSPASIQSGP